MWVFFLCLVFCDEPADRGADFLVFVNAAVAQPFGDHETNI